MSNSQSLGPINPGSSIQVFAITDLQNDYLIYFDVLQQEKITLTFPWGPPIPDDGGAIYNATTAFALDPSNSVFLNPGSYYLDLHSTSISTLYGIGISATATGPSASTYSITPVSPGISEHQGTEIFTITRTNPTGAATVYVSTVHDLGTNNPIDNYYYQGLLNQPVSFAAGVSSVQVPLVINDLGLTSGFEHFRIIAQELPTPRTDTTTGLLGSDDFFIINDNLSVPATTVYQKMYGVAPSGAELNTLVQFDTPQYAYGAKIGVADPVLYMYQALGLALASDTGSTTFTNAWGPTVVPSDVNFVAQAYMDVFHHSGSPAQVQHFVDQVNYFASIYTSSGAYGTDATHIDLLARGAVYGQILGVAAEYPSAVF